MRTFLRALKTVSVVTLIFFSWTYLPLYQIAAFAATKQEKTTTNASSRQSAGPSEKFEKLLEDLGEKTSKAEEKASKGEDTTSEIDAIKSRKPEVEALDADLRKEFAATEKKLRDANLPTEILNRHSAFVKNYEDNLSELRANIDAIEKAKTSAALKAEIAKTRTHLEKVKPPKKHVPLDPNKLPNRIVKAKERQPKLKKEEWEKELKKDSKKTKNAQRKPIIVASNGPLTGLISGTDSFSASEENLQLASADMAGLILSAATLTYPYPEEMYPLPWQTDMVPEDKQETPETHITDAIRAKAAELGNNPIKMFNWLRNNIYLVPSYGSIQGADMCLQTKQCNATDIASLTVAMFRAADWPARYEFQTVELDIDRFMENMGGFTDPMAAITFAATGGIPVRPVMSGGKITSVQFEHVFAAALLPEGFYIGAVMKKGWSRPMWMSLDVSLKHYVTTPGLDINSAVPFDGQSFVNQLQSTATINETEGYVTNVNSTLIQQTMQDYQTRVQDYISQNSTTTTSVADVIGKREIKPLNLPHLYPTGWTKAVTARIQSHTLPDSMKTTINFNIPDPTGVENGLTHTISLAEIAGKKVTLSYDPATVNDWTLLNNYGGDVTKVPPYLLTLRPVIKIDGNTVASGPKMTLGTSHDFTITFNEPGIGTERIQNILEAGGYSAIVLESQKFSYSTLEKNALKFKSTVEAIKNQLANGEQPSVDRDNLIGDWLWLQGLYYFYSLGKMLELTEWLNNVTTAKGVSAAITSAVPAVSYIFSMPMRFDLAGYGIDVDRNIFTVGSKTGNREKITQFMKMTGYISSILEHKHAEDLTKTPAISAISLMNEANKTGIAIFRVTKDNLASVLSKLEVSSDVLDDINSAIGAGKVVTVQAKPVSYFGTFGLGYIIEDPVTGAGAYKISGGSNGGYQALLYCLKDFLLTLIGLPAAQSLTTTTGTFVISMINWAQFSMDNALAMNWSSDPMSDPTVGYYFGLMLASLIATAGLVVLAFSGAIILALVLGIVIGTLLNYALMQVNSMQSGQPTPPFWCALPCGPVIVDAYQYWFTDDFGNFVNPCYQ